MVRRLTLLAAVVWILGTLFLWPGGQPAGVVLLSSDSAGQSLSIAGFDDVGRMVVTRLVSQQSVWPVGPVTLHDAKTGERLSTLYTGEERIEALRINQRLAVTRTNRAVRLVSLDGRVLIEHPGQFSGLDFPALLSPGATRFLAHDGLKLTVYDVPTAKVLWTRDDVERAAWNGDNAVHLWLNPEAAQESVTPTRFVCANAVTGALNPGNRKAFAEAQEGRLSPDGRLVWWISSGSPSDDPTGLYDLETNRLLWGQDIVRRNGMDPVRMRHLQFSDDSSELQYFYHVGEHRWGTARWRVSDGECVAPLPANAAVSALRGFMALAPDGSWVAYAKSETRARIAPIPSIVWDAPAWLSGPISDYLVETTDVVRVCDNVNNRLVAVIPQPGFRLTADADGSGLFLNGTPEITRYEVPPRMEYRGVWVRAALPAAALLLVSELIGQLWRKRRRRADAEPSVELVAASP